MYILDMALSLRRPQLLRARAGGVAAVVPVALSELAGFSSVRIYIPKDLRPPDARTLALKVLPRKYRLFFPYFPNSF